MRMFVREVSISYKRTAIKTPETAFCCSSQIASFLREIYPDIETREYFYVIYLNRRNRVLGYEMVSMGGMTSAIADPRLIFSSALKVGATCIIISHNHPSGGLKPSRADEEITNKIKKAGELLDIKLLDHVILTADNYFSFCDEGLI